MNFGLDDSIVADLQRVFARYPEIDSVLIFGSRAKGTFRDGSDIDLAVVSATLTPAQFSKLWAEVDELPLVFMIDLLHWDTLENVKLKSKIKQEGLIFFQVT
jgi:predicted nucleotidyltransferase